MNDPNIHPSTAPIEEKDQELGRNLRQIEKRDWWVWGYSIFVMLLLTLTIISLTLPALRQGTETIFKIKMAEAVFGLIALILLFNIYTIYQQILIKRLRRQLAEKQGHSDILRNLAMIDPLTGLYNRRFAEQRLVAEVAKCCRNSPPG